MLVKTTQENQANTFAYTALFILPKGSSTLNRTEIMKRISGFELSLVVTAWFANCSIIGCYSWYYWSRRKQLSTMYKHSCISGKVSLLQGCGHHEEDLDLRLLLARLTGSCSIVGSIANDSLLLKRVVHATGDSCCIADFSCK